MPRYLKINLILSVVVLLLPIIAGVILWDHLPESVPIHWNAQNEVNGYGSRLFIVAGLPALFLLFQMIPAGIIAFSAKKTDQKDLAGLVIATWLLPLISLFTSAFIYTVALGKPVNSGIVSTIVTCLVFLISGFVLWRYPAIKVINFPTKCIATRKFTGVLIMVTAVVSAVFAIFGLYYVLFFLSAITVITPIIYHFARGRHIG